MYVVSFLLAVFILLVVSTVLYFLSEKIEGKQEFVFHFGNVLLVTVIGSVLFAFWGWKSVVLVLGVFGGLWIIGSIVERLR